MRTTLRAATLAVAAGALSVILVPSANATPSRTGACSGCHSGPTLAVGLTNVSLTPTGATYDVSAPAADAIAVFSGSTKVARIDASAGRFTVATGGTYWVYAVAGPNTNSGLGSASIHPVGDVTPPVTTSNAQLSYEGTATVRLTAGDGSGTGVAATYHRLDGGPQNAGTTVVVSALGSHTLEFWSVDVAGNVETHKSVTFTVTEPPVPTEYSPVAGATRYDTAVLASERAFAGGAPCVVLATGANWPDALGGGALAGAKGGPILLTERSVLPPAVIAEIERLGATEAVILGGEGAIGPEVEDALVALLGAGNVSRLGGADRYQTAELVAQAAIAVLESGAGYDGTAFVGTGANFPDALAAAPLSAAKGWPLFLVRSTGPSAQTLAVMDSVGVNRAIILGGAGAVSADTEAALVAKYGDAAVDRIAGSNRFGTAVLVAAYGVANAGLAWDGLAITTGENYPDALAGGVMQGASGSVMLLTPKTALHADTAACLLANAPVIDAVAYLGGTGAVSDAVRAQVSTILD